MLDVLEIQDGAVAVRVTGTFTKQDYDKLYDVLAEQTAEHGKVDVFEAVVDFGFIGFLSTFIGIYHDIKYRDAIDLGRTAVVADSTWASLLTHIWAAITPHWTISPDDLRYYPMTEANDARHWIMTE